MGGRDPVRLPVVAAPPAALAPAAAGSAAPAGAPARRYFIETWGCQMNVHDSERFAGQLGELGFAPARSASDADLILLNTCSVRERAEEKLFSRLGRLRELKERRPSLVVGVAGCVAQQEQRRVLRRSGLVSFVIGTGAVGELGRLVREAEQGRRVVDVAMREDRFDELRPIARAPGRRAYVTVVEGCNKSCSFCIVPFTRGPEVNRPVVAIVAEVRAAVAAGALEIELLGQNVNAYRHGDVDFAGLLRIVAGLDGVRRLRFATSHPRELTRAVMEAMAECEAICPHLHLPVQSGSDSVLRRMARGYGRARYLDRIATLRSLVPDMGLSTDIIVGFPGETEAEFQDTLRLVDEVQFDQVFAFIYSPRPGTRAAGLPDPVAPSEKEERLARLFAAQDAIGLSRNERLVGRRMEVLVESPAKRGEGIVSGRTGCNRVVNFPGPAALVGRLVDVRIARALPHSLSGDPLDALDTAV